MGFNAVEYLTRLVSDSAYGEHHGMTAEETIHWLDELGLRYEFEERAAILEYDGGLSRNEAEAQALLEIKGRMGETTC